MNFRKIGLEDKDLVDAFTSRFGEGSCQHSFTTWYTLQEKYGDEIALEEDILFVRRGRLCTPERDVYLVPLGEADIRRRVELLMEDCHGRNRKLSFSTATQKAAVEIMEAFGSRFECEERRDYAEYIYRTEPLIRMEGPELAKKRNNLGRFRKNCEGDVLVEALSAENLKDVRLYCQCWMDNNMESHDQEALSKEYRCIERQLDHFSDLGLLGFLVRINQEVRGFCYGVPLSGEVFDGLIMKADRDVTQINVFMYSEIARRCGCPWLNAEEDVGVPGLRESKLSYRPAYLLKKYILREV